MAITLENKKRMVGTPTTNQNFAGGASTITGGTSPNTGIPSSITNPSSLKPGQQLTPPNPAVGSTTAGLSKPVGYEGAVKPIYTPGVSRIDSSGKDIAGTVGPLAKPAVPLATVPTTPATTGTTPTAQTGTVAPTNGQLTNDQNQQVAQGLDSNILDDTNNFANLGISEADFNNLPPDVRIKALEEKVAGVQQSEAIRKMTESALINERQKQYAQTQEANRLEQESINANLAGVQASQRLKDASQNLSNLKQNIGFLGTGGRPVKSAASLDAMQNNISEAQTTFQIMKNTEDQFAKLRGLQSEGQAKQFEENMARLDDQLKQQTTSLFLKARMETDQAFKKGLLDSPKKQLEFHQKMLSMVDDSLEGINQAQLAQYGALIEAGKTYAEQIKTQTEREQKLADEQRAGARKTDMERSKAMGILLDGNGDPILTSGGQEIPVPKDLPPGVTTIRDEEAGLIYIPKLNPDGSVGYDKIKVGTPKPKADTTLEDAIKKEQLIKLQKENGTYNEPTTTSPKGVPISEAIDKAITQCATGAQCGRFVNNVYRNATGEELGIGNDYASKEKAVDKIGAANTNSEIGAGSIFAYPVKNKDGTYTEAGHIGIVTAVNQDGTINIMDYNYNKDEKKREELNYDPNRIRNAGGVISKPIVSNQTVTPADTKLDTLDFENYVMNFVPQQDRGSDKEKARIISYVKEAMKGGRTAQQAGLAYRGFDIKDPANADKAMGYLDTLNNLPKFPDGGARIVSDLVNKGDIAGADRYVSNKVDDAVVSKYGADAIPTSSIQTQEKMINTLTSLIANNPDKIGAFDGRVTNLVKKFKDEPEMQQLQTLLAMVQSKTRKTFAGSNVTPSEMQALQDYVGGTTKMTPNNLLTMLNTVFENTRNEYQSQRAGYGEVNTTQKDQATVEDDFNKYFN